MTYPWDEPLSPKIFCSRIAISDIQGSRSSRVSFAPWQKPNDIPLQSPSPISKEIGLPSSTMPQEAHNLLMRQLREFGVLNPATIDKDSPIASFFPGSKPTSTLHLMLASLKCWENASSPSIRTDMAWNQNSHESWTKFLHVGEWQYRSIFVHAILRAIQHFTKVVQV